MYENKVVRIKLINSGFYMKPEEDYIKIIKDHTTAGWRFIQIFSPPITLPSGHATFYDLIFERLLES